MRVLLVDIDSLRYDHLGCYGYDRDTSPTIDSIAADGTVFDRCYASDTPCLPSRTAMATGRQGFKTGVVTHYGDGQWYTPPETEEDPDRPLSFRLLSESGVNTTTVTSFSTRHQAYHFAGSFRQSIQPTTKTGLEDATEVTATATDWLEENADNNDWLLHVNYWDVHHPYSVTDETIETVRESGDLPAWPDQDTIDEQQSMTGPHSADLWATPAQKTTAHYSQYDEGWPDQITDRADYEHIIDRYDASIRKVDRQIAALLDTLDAAGVREDTVVVVTADHGEAMGEHGIYVEHAMAHPPCQQIPMVVSWPGVTTDRTENHVDEQIYQFDLVATLCDMQDIDIPSGWDAEPFTDALRGESFEGRETIVCGHGIYTFSRAVYTDEWVYIDIIHPGLFSYPGLFNDPELPNHGLELLHDRESDPNMTENLIEERTEVATDLRSRLDAWTSQMLRDIESDGSDPLQEMAVSDGPFLYYTPEDMLEAYREMGVSTEKIERIEQSRSFPYDLRSHLYHPNLD